MVQSPKICDMLVHAELIVTQDENRSIIKNGSIAINAGRIAAIGPRAVLAPAWTGREELELGKMMILPGLINAHTHASMTFLRGFADDLPLMEWLTKHIFPMEQKIDASIVETGAMLGYAEMLRTGTTSCIDMYLFEDAVFKAAETAGIRCLGGEAVFNFPSGASSGAAQSFELTRAYAAKYKNHSRIKVAVNTHSVYTTTPEILDQSRELAEELGIPLHIHLAETPSETAQSLQMWGKRPVALAHERGLLGIRSTLAHVVDVNDEDLTMLAQGKAVVAHNPSSNMKLASGFSPIGKMRAKGIKAALGTDGAASNNMLNIFMEMRLAALMHKGHALDPTAVPANEALDMATLGGAAAMHQPELGSLAVGQSADLAALDLNSPNFQPMYNPVSHVVYASTGMETRLTMVEGEVLYHDGKFLRFDYHALINEAEKLRAWVNKNR